MREDPYTRNVPPNGHQRWVKDGYAVTNDPAEIDVAVLHAWFDNSSQTATMPVSTIELMMAGSLNFGLLDPEGRTVGYGRLVTDYATFAYLGDVFLNEPVRGKGLGRFLFECMFGHRDLQGLRRWLLMCGPVNVELYKKFGFVEATGESGKGHALHMTDVEVYLKGLGKTSHALSERS